MALIRFHEGTRYDAYKDTSKKISCDGTKGLWTWGVGWCLETRPATNDEKAMIAGLSNDTTAPWDDPKALGAWLTKLADHHKIIIAGFMLRNEVEKLLPEIETKFGYWPDLDDNRATAIVDICYNMGIGVYGKSGFLEFVNTNTMIAKGQWVDAARNLLDSEYHRELVPHRPYPGFVLRSERIAKIIETGDWPEEVEKPYDA
jgi:GH24 family phage-related lysozyme (muramidase)